MNNNEIVIKGARERNLKNISLTIPRDQLVVISGLSGSGKSSLVFDTIHQEGQRRFLESLSAYARQFLGQMHRPNVDSIEGLSPSLCIDQKTVNRNPRSTVGTITEISGYLRLLLARLGTPHCPKCQSPLIAQSPIELAKHLLSQHPDSRLEIYAPLVVERKGEYRRELLQARRDGYTYARIDGELRDLQEDITLARYEKHTIELRVDRLKTTSDSERRLSTSIEKALLLSQGLFSYIENDKYHLVSSKRSCPKHGTNAPELEPRLFSFNDPQGQCTQCMGLGYYDTFDFDAIFTPDTPIIEAFIPFGEDGRLPFSHLDKQMWPGLLKTLSIDPTKSWSNLSEAEHGWLIKGKKVPYTLASRGGLAKQRNQWPGLEHTFNMVLKFAPNTRLAKYKTRGQCRSCKGSRLNPIARSVTFQHHNMDSLSETSIQHLHNFFSTVTLGSNQQLIGEPIIRQLMHRLDYLVQVGLGYLSLNRQATTLSGGEAQRIRLAAQVGSGLQGVTYILDEPSIGLHHRDQLRLLNVLEQLRDKGNSILVVEHDPLTMSKADFCIEVGPKAGREGGEIQAAMSRRRFIHSNTLTATYLRGEAGLSLPTSRRAPNNGSTLVLTGATGNNLKNITVSFPLNQLIVVTGVSGSGKSTLVQETLSPLLHAILHQAEAKPLPYERLDGIEHIDKIISIDQKPIGRSSRSNPVTYTKVWGDIRTLFSQSIEAKRRGYTPSRFSFNVAPENGGGRCEECDGGGVKVIEMQFLENVEVECEACEGQRFNEETLQIRYNGKNIYEVLEMSISEAAEFFENQPKIHRILNVIESMGLGYIQLGQPSTTISGGEAQRIKLATELHKRSKGHTLYVLDEPSTGLHMADVARLVGAMDQLIEDGHTVLVIEHDLDIIKMADHIIDLGPEGGAQGGEIMGYGTPEHIATLDTPTGQALQQVLAGDTDLGVESFSNKYTRKVQHHNILVEQAATHNLKNIDVEIPKGEMTVITGPSGSGKSSLAFHTIFAEGQLRYIESLSTYARRFLGGMQRPPVNQIQGLTPAIAIDQSNRSRSPRSTVATSTEIYDIYRLIFARAGVPHCHVCNKELEAHSPTKAAMLLTTLDSKGLLLAHTTSQILVQHLLSDGIVRIWKDHEQIKLDTLEPTQILNNPTLIVDRFTPSKVSRQRLASSIELAYSFGQDVAIFHPLSANDAPITLTREHRCVEHNTKLPEKLSPRQFSFNTKLGACTTCDGLGRAQVVEWDLLFPEPNNGFWEAMHGWASIPFKQSRKFCKILPKLLKIHNYSIKTPVQEYSLAFRDILMHGRDEQLSEWDGLTTRIYRWTGDISWLCSDNICPSCSGDRLQPTTLAITIANQSISKVCTLTVDESIEFWSSVIWSPTQHTIVQQPLLEIQSRLQFLQEVGLGYLELNRQANTLSGGESQRIRLASQLGSKLTRTIYVLDEPTIGLHPHNTEQLLNTLHRLKSYNNTLLLVEHDPHVIASADHIIEMGPLSGEWGGEVITTGNYKTIASSDCLTGQYLSGTKKVYTPSERRTISEWMDIPSFSRNNVENVQCRIPTGALTVITGVSGSGKSTLVMDGIAPYLKGFIDELPIDKVISIDQSPISKSPRSTTCSFTGVLDKIRDVFVKSKLAKERGYSKGHFSYNVEKGRCPTCEGKGATLIEMHFISDIWVPCPVCDGARYNESVLDIQWNGRNIADVLQTSVKEATQFFDAHQAISKRLDALNDVGLGYLRLGQPTSELSGGERQRLKLANELAKGRRAKATCFILDEPTTGLHTDDVNTLLKVLHKLVDLGHTVLVIEHNVDVWASADYLIEMGPDAGADGGQIVFTGTPEMLIQYERSTKSKSFLLHTLPQPS